MLKKSEDPFFAREAKKYDHPVPSREYILQLLNRFQKPISLSELLHSFDLQKKEEIRSFRKRLDAMVRDGQLIQNRKRCYGLVSKMDLLYGDVMPARDGYGFLIPEDGGPHVFLPNIQMRQVFGGERVLVHATALEKGRREGVIVEVVERRRQEIAGRLIQKGKVFYVVPENPRIHQDILIPKEEMKEAEVGQIVVAKILEYPTIRTQAVGRISRILGEHRAPGMEIQIAITMHGLPHQWSKVVTNECKQISTSISKKEIARRTDLRSLPFVTIDGEDAKDFDDAVYCERRKTGGYRLWVAIADVSHYVAVETKLDEAAQERGTSVYFPGKVVPMLPEVLSNELCSLKPEVDRLVLAVELLIDDTGQLTRWRFVEGVIRSQARLTYTYAQALLESPPEDLMEIEIHLKKQLDILYELFRCLSRAREERGVLDLDTLEIKAVMNRNQKIESFVTETRLETHRIIEECMIMANIAAAKCMLKHKVVGVYRNHPPPPPDKIKDFQTMLSYFDLKMPGGRSPTPHDFEIFLKKIAKRSDKHVLQVMLLRSLSQAVYGEKNGGHFGLGLEYYTHFTSPIRRYSDLLVHRAIRHIIQNQPAKAFTYSLEKMRHLAVLCSVTERRADTATRDVMKALQCEYMLAHLGKEFDAIVMKVTSFGLFVEMEPYHIEGLVHISALPEDYYHYDQARQMLEGESEHYQYTIGQIIRVVVKSIQEADKIVECGVVFQKKKKLKKKTTSAKK